MSPIDLIVLQSVYALSDDIDYNLYEAVDVAEYAHLEQSLVEERLQALYKEGYLGECMSYADDGIETFHLTHKGLETLENGL